MLHHSLFMVKIATKLMKKNSVTFHIENQNGTNIRNKELIIKKFEVAKYCKGMIGNNVNYVVM